MAKPSIKTRDSDCCSINFLKYFFHIFNIVFLLSGLGILTVGVWTVWSKREYVALLTTATYPLTAYVLVVTGLLVLGVAGIACCGVCRENRCLLLVNTFLLVVIFLLEAMVGLMACIYQDQVHTELGLSLNSTFLDYYRVDLEKTAAVDLMQQQLKCCGAVSFEDWPYSRWLREGNSSNLVPDSCCKTPSPGCGRRNHPSNIYYKDCLSPFSRELEDHLSIVGAVGLGISVVQVFGMILSCCLYIKLKDVVDFGT